MQRIKSFIPAPLRPMLAKIYRHYFPLPHRNAGEPIIQEKAQFNPSANGDSQVSLNASYINAKNQKGWLFIDHPTQKEITLEQGVFSVRGWAWSTQYGRGDLRAEITGNDGFCKTISIRHRINRPAINSVFSEIPTDNFAGFELSIDRFDLPEQCEVNIIFQAEDENCQIGPIFVKAIHNLGYQSVETIPCNACGSTHLAVVGKKDSLTIVKCQNCGLHFTNPRPDIEQVHMRYSKDYFEKEYLPLIQKSFDSEKVYWASVLDMLDRFKSVGSELFEIGVGAGYLLDMANKRGWKGSGIELNQEAVNFARKELGLNVVSEDVIKMDLPANKFAAIIMESTIEHFIDPAAVIAKCAKALHPGGGLFIASISSEGNNFSFRGMDMEFIGPSEHLYYFSAAALMRMCETAGLRVESFWRDGTCDAFGMIATRRIDLFEPENQVD